jgi:hypothetical protein
MMVLRQSVRVSIHGDHRGELAPEAVGWFDGRTPSNYRLGVVDHHPVDGG